MKLHSSFFGDTQAGVAPLIILHGLFGTGRNWEGIARRMSARRPVITLDLPNHGRSTWVADIDYEGMARAVSGFLASQGIERAVAMGHSMGGKTAMTLALIQPQLVTSLIVIDIAPVPYDHTNRHYIDALMNLPVDRIATRADADAALMDDISDPGLRAFLLTNLERSGNGFEWRINLEGLGECLSALLSFPASDKVDDYLGPALFVGGETSDYILPEHEMVIRQMFPNARITVVAGAGHWVHADKPEALLATVEGFLDAV